MKVILSSSVKKDLIEKLSDLEHKQWMWYAKDIVKEEDLSKERVDRWEKECFKPYEDLTEEVNYPPLKQAGLCKQDCEDLTTGISGDAYRKS